MKIMDWLKRYRKIWIPGALGAGLLAWKLGGTSKVKVRSQPNFKWTYPTCPADKLQYLLDICSLGFEGQGTVYTASDSWYDKDEGVFKVEGNPGKAYAREIKYPIGFNCSRLTGLGLGWWLNVNQDYKLGTAYSSETQAECSIYGSAHGNGHYYGYSEYAKELVYHKHDYRYIYDVWDELGQINTMWLDNCGSGHTWLIFKITDSFRPLDPQTRQPYPVNTLLRVAADGGRPNGVYTATKTAIQIKNIDDNVGNCKNGGKYVYRFVSYKSGDNDDSCMVTSGPCKGRKTAPLLFEYLNW